MVFIFVLNIQYIMKHLSDSEVSNISKYARQQLKPETAAIK